MHDTQPNASNGVQNKADALARRVLWSGIVGCSCVGTVVVAHLLFDPFRTEVGHDALAILAAIAFALFWYGMIISMVYMPRSTSKPHAFLMGLLVNVIGFVLGMAALMMLE